MDAERCSQRNKLKRPVGMLKDGVADRENSKGPEAEMNQTHLTMKHVGCRGRGYQG